MSDDPGFKRRVNEAYLSLLQRLERRKIPAREIGEEVARLAHRDRPYTHSAVNGWFAGARPRTTEEQAALAAYLGVEVSWLVFGIPVTGVVRGDEAVRPPHELPPAEPVPRPVPRPIPRPAAAAQKKRRKHG